MKNRFLFLCIVILLNPLLAFSMSNKKAKAESVRRDGVGTVAKLHKPSNGQVLRAVPRYGHMLEGVTKGVPGEVLRHSAVLHDEFASAGDIRKNEAFENNGRKNCVDTQGGDLGDAFEEFEEATARLRKVMMNVVLRRQTIVQLQEDGATLGAQQAVGGGEDLDETGEAATGSQSCCVSSGSEAQEQSDEQWATRLLPVSGDVVEADHGSQELEEGGSQDDDDVACAPETYLGSQKVAQIAISMPQDEITTEPKMPSSSWFSSLWEDPTDKVLRHVRQLERNVTSLDYLSSEAGQSNMCWALQELEKIWETGDAELNFERDCSMAAVLLGRDTCFFEFPNKYNSAKLTDIKDIVVAVRKYKLPYNTIFFSIFLEKIRKYRKNNTETVDHVRQAILATTIKQLRLLDDVEALRDRQFGELIAVLSSDKKITHKKYKGPFNGDRTVRQLGDYEVTIKYKPQLQYKPQPQSER